MRTLSIVLAATAAAAIAVPAAAREDAPQGGAWIDCQVGSIQAFRDRLVVKCAGPAGGEAPREFALEMVDRMADSVLRLSIEAKGRGKPLGLLYVKDKAANPAGCDVERCRRVAGVELK